MKVEVEPSTSHYFKTQKVGLDWADGQFLPSVVHAFLCWQFYVMLENISSVQ